MTRAFIRKMKGHLDTDRNTQERRACDKRGRERSDVSKPRNAKDSRQLPEVGGGKGEVFSSLQREHGPADTPIAGLWPSEQLETNFLLL